MSLVRVNLQSLLQKLLSPNSPKSYQVEYLRNQWCSRFAALHHPHPAPLAGPALRTRHSFLYLFKAAASQELTLSRVSPTGNSQFLTDTYIHIFNTRGFVSHSLKLQRNSHVFSVHINSQPLLQKNELCIFCPSGKKKNQVISDIIKTRIGWIKNTMQPR